MLYTRNYLKMRSHLKSLPRKPKVKDLHKHWTTAKEQVYRTHDGQRPFTKTERDELIVHLDHLRDGAQAMHDSGKFSEEEKIEIRKQLFHIDKGLKHLTDHEIHHL